MKAKVDVANEKKIAQQANSTASSTALTVVGEMRMTSNAPVLPPKGTTPMPLPFAHEAAEEESFDYDNRTNQDIIWGAAREHTLFGFTIAILFGDGPKLPTIAQATQLFWSTTLGMLFLTTVQLRYTWLGGTETSININAFDRLSVVSNVAIVTALITWPCALAGRWLFLIVNRAQVGATVLQVRLLFGSAWSIIIFCCMALAVGAINMSSNMDASLVTMDCMVGWFLSMGALWLIMEPTILGLFAMVGLVLKWCTTFDDLPVDEANPREKGC